MSHQQHEDSTVYTTNLLGVILKKRVEFFNPLRYATWKKLRKIFLFAFLFPYDNNNNQFFF